MSVVPPNQVWRYWYRPVASDKISDGVGHLGAGFLAAEVARYMREKRDYGSRCAATPPLCCNASADHACCSSSH
jgi:hypothetical protein